MHQYRNTDALIEYHLPRMCGCGCGCPLRAPWCQRVASHFIQPLSQITEQSSNVFHARYITHMSCDPDLFTEVSSKIQAKQFSYFMTSVVQELENIISFFPVHSVFSTSSNTRIVWKKNRLNGTALLSSFKFV